jgi:hypothetical protein
MKWLLRFSIGRFLYILAPACYPCDIEKDALFYFLNHNLVHSDNWLKSSNGDDHHFGYITKLTPSKEKRKRVYSFVSEIGSLIYTPSLDFHAKVGHFSFVGFWMGSRRVAMGWCPKHGVLIFVSGQEFIFLGDKNETSFNKIKHFKSWIQYDSPYMTQQRTRLKSWWTTNRKHNQRARINKKITTKKKWTHQR